MTHAEKTIARLLNDGDAIVRSIVEEDGIRYYAVDDLINQKTLHAPVSELKLWFLTADTTNGVQLGNEQIDCTSDPVSQKEFFDSLMILSDEECIGSYVTYQMKERINEKYGVA